MHLTRFQLGEIQQIVQEEHEALAGFSDLAEIVGQFLQRRCISFCNFFESIQHKKGAGESKTKQYLSGIDC